MKPEDKERCKFWNDLKSGKFAELVSEASAGEALSNSNEAYSILKPLFALEDDVEKVYFIFLNAKNRIISIECLFSGSLTGAAVYPREVVKKILNKKAAALIMAHNHPSGNLTPSSEDFNITVNLVLAVNAIGVSLHDHMIISNGYYSMANDGIMERISERVNQLLRTPLI